MRRIDFFAEVANEEQTNIHKVAERATRKQEFRKELSKVMTEWGLVEPIFFETNNMEYQISHDGTLAHVNRRLGGFTTMFPIMGFRTYVEIAEWLLDEMPPEEIT